MNVAVIGLGKLGLPLAALLASNGNCVKGFDLDDRTRFLLRNKEFASSEPELMSLLRGGGLRLEIVEDIRSAVNGAEVVFVIVPTPSLQSGHFSNTHVLKAIDDIAQSIDDSQRVVIDIVSTVMPGSCEGPIRQRLELGTGKKLGSEIGLCYNPEFIALGSVIKDMQFPDMLLIGQSSDWAGKVVERALKSIVKREVPVQKMKLIEAELVKIAINNYVTMKISYANMLMQGSQIIGGIDIDTVTDAVGLDSRIGNKYLKAAAPYGGPCFPRDTRALSALYKDLGLSDSLSRATEDINESHIVFVADLISQRVRVGSRIGIAGLSYKTGTKVIEESAGLAIAKVLECRGFEILFWDDEGASLDSNEHTISSDPFKIISSDHEFVSSVDFVLISRPLNDPVTFAKLLNDNQKSYLDLWREISVS